MKAAQLIAPRKFRFVEIDPPTLADAPPNSVIVRVDRACICGSDSPFFLRDMGAYPAPPGLSIHECIGSVAASSSPRFEPGDRVLAVPDGQTGLAEYFITSAERTVPLGDRPFSNEILMAQPLGTVIWAMRKLPNLLHWNTVVLGQGPMGLLIDAMLSNLGAKTVIAVDRVPERLAVSPKMRATHSIHAGHMSVVERVAEITRGRMADLVVEVVGHQTETLNECLPLVRDGGTILAFGVPDDEVYPFRFKELFHRNLTLIGSVVPEAQRDYPLAIDMIAQGRIDVAPILTHEVPFVEEAVQRAYETFTGREDGAIKIVIRMENGGSNSV